MNTKVRCSSQQAFTRNWQDYSVEKIEVRDRLIVLDLCLSRIAVQCWRYNAGDTMRSEGRGEEGKGMSRICFNREKRGDQEAARPELNRIGFSNDGPD